MTTPGRPKHRGLVYVRRSRKKQETGIHEQLKWARLEAERLGVRMDVDGADLDAMAARGLRQAGGVYLDDGVSGSVMDRPGFLAFRKAALVDRRVGHVFIHLSDRFARPEQAHEAMQAEIELLLAGVTVVFSNRVSLPRERGRHYFAEDVQLLHEYTQNGEFLTKLAGRVLQTQKRLAEEGNWNGGPAPYGFARVLVDALGREVRELQPGETVKQAGCRVRIRPADRAKIAVWLHVLDLHGNHGWGHKRIANHLNDLGVPSPHADAPYAYKTSRGGPPLGKWWGESVRRLIANEAIVGRTAFGKTAVGVHRRLGPDGPRLLSEADRDGDGEAKPVANLVPIVAATGFAPAADEELFRRCRELTERRGRSQRGIPRSRDLSRYPLSSRVFDLSPGCGAVLFGRKEGDRLRYECSKYRQSGGRECHRHVVDAEPALAYVTGLLRQQVAKVGGAAAIRERLLVLAKTEATDERPALDELGIAEARLAELGRESETVAANLGRAKSDAAYRVLEEKFESLRAEADRLRDQAEGLRAKAAMTEASGSPEAEVEAALSLLEGLERVAEDPDARAELAGLLRALDVKVWLSFMPNPKGRRPLRAVRGGVVTIGPGPDPRSEGDGGEGSGEDEGESEGGGNEGGGEGDGQGPPDAGPPGGGACPPAGGGRTPAAASRRRQGRTFRKGTGGKPPVAPYWKARKSRGRQGSDPWRPQLNVARSTCTRPSIRDPSSPEPRTGPGTRGSGGGWLRRRGGR